MLRPCLFKIVLLTYYLPLRRDYNVSMNSDICTHLSPLEGYEGIQADNENLIVESSIFALFQPLVFVLAIFKCKIIRNTCLS